jgi:predicted alpha/beta-hydrolase family hydrolase
VELLTDGPDDAPATILLAHGAGAPMDSKPMTGVAQALAGEGLRVARFEFGYMAARREGQRRPPPRAEKLIPEYLEAVAALNEPWPLVIGGKSMGGRVASMAADELHAAGAVAGLLCIGYPFHPPAKPEQTRTRHLETLATPALIFQGTRDPFGSPNEVAGYQLAPRVEIHWLEDGDHDLKPRKRVSGLTADDHLASLARVVATWVGSL